MLCAYVSWKWIPCRAGETVPPGAISGDEQVKFFLIWILIPTSVEMWYSILILSHNHVIIQGSVYLARATIQGNPTVKKRQAPLVSFPGCVRAFLGEDGTTPCLHKADIPTNNSIITRQHFDVLCIQQFVKPVETFDGYNVSWYGIIVISIVELKKLWSNHKIINFKKDYINQCITSVFLNLCSLIELSCKML